MKYLGSVPMSKLNWAARQDFDFVNNYKVLQTCFSKLSVDRHIDVDRLIKGKYQVQHIKRIKIYYIYNICMIGQSGVHAVVQTLLRNGSV